MKSSLQELIAARRSTKISGIKSDPVPSELIRTALEAANWAPSHGDTEPWRFVVYQGEARLRLGEAFADAYREIAGAKFRQETSDAQRERALGAAVWIAIGMEPMLDHEGKLKMPLEEELIAMGGAVQNLHLTLTELGLTGKWHSKGVSVHAKTKEFIGWDDRTRLLGFFYLGWPSQPTGAGSRRPIEERVRWED